MATVLSRSAVVVNAARAFQTATTTVSGGGGGAVSPTDTNANPNLFGNSGPTPVIPAFVLSGVLLVVLVSICTWRRMLAARQGAGVVPRYGPFGIAFVPVGEGWRAGAGAGRRGEGREEALGPRPELWDAYATRTKLGCTGLDGCLWEGMKPLSLSLRRRSPDLSQRPGTSLTPATDRQPYLLRKLLQLKSGRLAPRTHPNASPSQEEEGPIVHEVDVSVLIRMPSPTRPQPRRFSSGATSTSEKEKDIADIYNETDELDDFNYALGVARVPLAAAAGTGEKS